jgi:hypothetical protein
MDSATHYSEAGFSLLFRPTSSEPAFGCRGSPHLRCRGSIDSLSARLRIACDHGEM